jgi:hypothetical protein
VQRTACGGDSITRHPGMIMLGHHDKARIDFRGCARPLFACFASLLPVTAATPVIPGGADAPPAFLPARPITQADLATLTERVRRRVIRWFRLAGLLDAAAAADMLAWENSGFSIDASVRITLKRPRCAELFSESRTPAAVLRPAAAESPPGRGPMASSSSHRSSSWTGSAISCRRRGSTGIATTGCLRTTYLYRRSFCWYNRRVWLLPLAT